MNLSPFHLAIPVYDLPAARRFYGEIFGLEEGRSSSQWATLTYTMGCPYTAYATGAHRAAPRVNTG